MFGRRAALFAGASLSAMAMVAPAQAQVTPGLGGPVAPDANGNVNQTLTITLAGETFQSGEIDTGAPITSAIVDNVLNGGIEQSGTATGTGVLAFIMDNAGTATVLSQAGAVSAGSATANAGIGLGVLQVGSGPSDASVALSNSGNLTVEAAASSDAGTASSATAMVETPILQVAAGSGAAGATLENAGTININLSADATSTGGDATANSQINYGLQQEVIGGIASATLVNAADASLNVNLTSNATAAGGNPATAVAGVNDGAVISQLVQGATSAVATFDNGGEVAIVFAADANAPGSTAGAAAFANALSQTVGSDGAAETSFNNGEAGSLTLDASATATGDTGAEAEAWASSLVSQQVTGDEASASIANDGDMLETALADANGGTGSAIATAAGLGAYQSVLGATSAEAAIVNSATGVINIDVTATADGADATASVEGQGVNQGASAGTVSASLENAGSFSVALLADALADVDGVAQAQAVGIGIAQSGYGDIANVSFLNAETGSIELAAEALAEGDVATAGAGFTGIVQQLEGVEVQASISNDGDILESASAQATGVSTATANVGGAGFIQILGGQTSGEASLVNNATGVISLDLDAAAYALGAFAGVEAQGLLQVAEGAEAQASIINDGSMAFTASADAQGFDVEASVGIVGIQQGAGSATNGNGLAIIDNGGTLGMSAIADATDPDGEVAAEAGIIGIVQQAMVEVDGTATAELSNGGDITLLAEANADGDILAEAEISSMVMATQEVAVGGSGDASASMTNAGSFLASASAEATVDNGAVGATSTSRAVGSGFAQNVDAANGNALASFGNSGDIGLSVSAGASGPAGASSSLAILSAGLLMDVTAAGGDANAEFDNSGNIAFAVDATATATDGDMATAFAEFGPGIVQAVTATSADESASASLVNSGTVAMSFSANATASADGTGTNAVVQGIGAAIQEVSGSDASATFDNSGEFVVDVSADASGGFSTAAVAFGGIGQLVSGESADVDFNNSGVIAINGEAVVEGTDTFVNFGLGAGVAQLVEADDVEAAFFNSNEMAVLLIGTATATAGVGDVLVQAESIFAQDVIATATGAAFFDNSGSIGAQLSASSTSAHDAEAEVGGTVVWQSVEAVDAVAELTNSGDIIATGSAFADAGTAGDDAGYANVSLTGVSQEVDGSASQSASLVNSGTVVAQGSSEGLATESAFVGASVAAVLQVVGVDAPASVNFENEGSIAAEASSEAEAVGGADGYANAYGYGLYGYGGSIGVEASNAGTIEASASATSSGIASAYAEGAELWNDDVTGIGELTGSFDNGGSIEATASVDGVTADADAVGLYVVAGDIGELTLTNSGSISAEAIASGGGGAEAYAILVEDNGAAAGGTGIFTLDNSGDIIARVSVDGGVTFTRGMAIDVSAASNNSQINLLGGGNIYGNVALQAGDVVTVSDGETVFDGIINPACVGSADPSACGVGTLEIADGGSFFMRDNVGAANYAGPSQAYVASLTIAPEGTLVLELPTSSDPAVAEAAYPQIFTDTAEIDGTLVARPAAAMNGLYGDEYFFDNVIDANTLTGTFDACTLENGSPLLQLQCIYDDENNVDLGIIRIAFGDVPGMTQNQQSVADGIDCFYDVALDGPSAVLIAQLFTLGEEGYLEALDQLAGAGIANYVQSFNSLGVRYTRIIDRSLDCGAETRRGPIGECREDGIRLWGQMDYGSHRQDGDQEAATYDTDQWSWLVGVDTNIGNAGVAGISLAKVTNKVDSFRFGTKVEASGWQVGGWAAYDPGPFYLRAIGSFSSYDGDSSREISIGTVEGTVHGDPDIRQWTLGLHAGARFQLGNGILTPFLNLDRINTRLKGFDEEGVPGANLAVKSGTEKRTYATLGTRYDLKVAEKVSLGATLGWQHMFGDRRSSFTANFCDQPQACDFTIISTAEKKDSLIAGLSLGGDVGGGTTLRVGYDGTYNSRQSTHSAYLKLSVPLGGK